MTSIPDHSWWHQKEALAAYAKCLDSTAKVALKTSKIWNIGALRRYTTTIGRTVYIPAANSYEVAKDILPHEVLGHVRQFRWAGFFIHPTVGIPLGLILYALVPFFILFAWVRYRAELHAETKSWQYHLSHKTMTVQYVRVRAVRAAKAVGGKPYLYAVPKFWALWGFKRRAEKIINAAS